MCGALLIRYRPNNEFWLARGILALAFARTRTSTLYIYLGRVGLASGFLEVHAKLQSS